MEENWDGLLIYEELDDVLIPKLRKIYGELLSRGINKF